LEQIFSQKQIDSIKCQRHISYINERTANFGGGDIGNDEGILNNVTADKYFCAPE
jgi:hypothetical protein